MIELKMKVTGIKEALDSFSPEVVQKAVRSALNKTGTQGLNQLISLITERYTIKKADIKKFLYISRKPRVDNLSLQIQGLGKGLALSYFDPKQEGKKIRGPKKARTLSNFIRGAYKPGPVTVQVLFGVRKAVSPVAGRKVFLAQMRSGHIGVFVRKSGKRLGISQLFGPGVAGILQTRDFREKTEKFMASKFKEIFSHELKFYQSKNAGPSD